jgi:hypothetical protein
MDETYRMLGREHEADLERDAQKFRRADEVRASGRASAPSADERRKRERLVPARVVALLVRAARAEG